MSSQTPNINLTLPTGAEKVSRQIINDNNTKIDTAIGTLNNNISSENLGTLANPSALETALLSLSATMNALQFKNVRFSFSASPSSGAFKGKTGFYIGTLKKSNDSVLSVDVQNSGTGNQLGEYITGTYNGSAWTWNDLNPKTIKETGMTLSASNVTSDTYILGLESGVYKIAGNKSSYLPTRYGVLIKFNSGASYGTCVVFSTEGGLMYFRSFYDNAWHTNNWFSLTGTAV